MRIDFRGLAIGLIIVFGLFGPWVIKSYDSYPALNPDTRQGELHYHKQIMISPINAKLYEDGQLVNTLWFVNSGMSLACGIFLSVSVLSILNFKKYWINFILFFSAIFGVVVFFMSFGTGLGIGLKTSFGWGLSVSLLGMALMFVQAVSNVTKKTAIAFPFS